MPYVDVPWALVAAPLLAAAVALLVLFAARRRERRLRELGTPTAVQRLVPALSNRRPWRRSLLLATAAACAGVAFAGPRWGTEQEVAHGSGIDIVLAMDASLSMLATDERPDRLTREKEEARRLLAMSGADRFGLIAFAGRSYILTPLTVDQGALALFLDNLDPSIVGEAGTSISRAIRQGTDLLLATHTASDRALVVMSDGEAFEPVDDITAAAKRAADAGITVVTVGFGTEAGSTIPQRGPRGVITRKRDENGQVVVTRYQPDMLRAAALAAHGVFIPASATDKASRIRRALSTLRREGRTAQAGRDRRPRFQLFLIPALLLVLVDTLLGERRGPPRAAPAGAPGGRARGAGTIPTPRHASALVVALLVLPVHLRPGDAAEGDRLFRARRYHDAAAAYERAIRSGHDSPRLEYNLGTALLAAGSAEDAIAALERAVQGAGDSELRYRALFNLGLIYLDQGRQAKGSQAGQAYQSAVEAYKRALRLRPDALDAKWNYELANRRRKQSGGGGGGGGGQPQQQHASPATGQQPAPRPTAGLDRQQAERILDSAEREERDTQSRKQRENQPTRPPGGKDW